MRRIDLSGEWSVRKAGSKKSLLAQVPGCVHADLLAAREIENPVPRKNLECVAWVADSEWVYEKLFVSEDFSTFDRVILRFDGLDTCATIRLNDTVLGQMSNLFETFEFEVKALIKPGKNKLTVTFVPAGHDTARPASGVIRRQTSSTQGGTQPKSPTMGIWRGVSVIAFSCVRVTDMLIHQDFSVSGIVGLDVSVTTERYAPDQHLEILARVCYKGNILFEARDILAKEQTVLHLNIKNPQLWWPAGLGEQPLYEVTVDILAGRACHEHVSRRIGLCTFVEEKGVANGRPFRRFLVNRHPLFLKGASWLPADLYVARLTRMEYARLVKAAAMANMNVLRVWGGGIYESDAFYDLCDEYGICVWQDMMLTGTQSEKPDAAALAAFEREARQNIQRVRHHACMMVWCGGDSSGPGIAKEYEQAASALVATLDPDRPYLPATAHLPFSLDGDPAYEPLPSYPEPRVVAEYLNEEERNISHPACAFHVTPPEGAKQVYTAFLERFLMPSSFDNALWLSQIQQGLAVREQMARVRMGVEPPTGFIYWQLNDCWPGCSPSSVDSEGRWKALHYMARRFFAPLWLCGGYRAEPGLVEIFAFNDGLKPFKGEIQWRLIQMDGMVIAEGVKKVALASASREKAISVKVQEALRKIGAAHLLLWIYLLDEQGNQVAWNKVLFCSPRELALQPPRIRAEIRTWDDNSFAVTLTSHYPAMWVWISLERLNARYDDNFFCLEPEKPFRVR
ncbi:MAG: glycoside hydrolase family 2 protein, partial [bacterium]